MKNMADNVLSRRKFFQGAATSIGLASISVAAGSHFTGLDKDDRYKTGLTMLGLTSLTTRVFSHALMRNDNDAHTTHMMSEAEKLAEFEALAIEDQERRAIHESGHAVAALLLKSITLEGMTIIRYQDEETNVNAMVHAPNRIESVTANIFKEMMMRSLAGKLAEEIFYGDNNYADGSYTDITHVTQMARLMVSGLGMNQDLGTMNFEDETVNDEIVSERTKQQIEDEVSNIIASAENEMKALLVENEESIRCLAIAILDKKTMNPEEVMQVTGLENTYDSEDLDPLGLREASI